MITEGPTEPQTGELYNICSWLIGNRARKWKKRTHIPTIKW